MSLAKKKWRGKKFLVPKKRMARKNEKFRGRKKNLSDGKKLYFASAKKIYGIKNQKFTKCPEKIHIPRKKIKRYKKIVKFLGIKIGAPEKNQKWPENQ